MKSAKIVSGESLTSFHLLSFHFHSLVFSEINECDSAPCKNGGTCKEEGESTLLRAPFEKDVENFYTCVCKPGYTGKNCEIGKNEEIPCFQDR